MQGFRFLLAAALLWGASLAAQPYQTGAGLRLGWDAGLTVKHFPKPQTAIEGVLHAYPYGYWLTILIEKQVPAFDLNGLYWYYGAGAHAGLWADGPRGRYYDWDEAEPVLGIDGVLGLEYVIGDIPFTVGIDWKPMLNFNVPYNSPWLFVNTGGASIRYVF